VPALEAREIGASVDARVVVLARRELPEDEYPAQGGARRGQLALVDELLLRLGARFQQELEDALPPGLDLGIFDLAERYAGQYVVVIAPVVVPRMRMKSS
jgi:hypothetical protein